MKTEFFFKWLPSWTLVTPTIVDFEEWILLPSIRAATRIWEQDRKIVGFAFVDEFNNLWFEAELNLTNYW
jgi:hypothetical protein